MLVFRPFKIIKIFLIELLMQLLLLGEINCIFFLAIYDGF